MLTNDFIMWYLFLGGLGGGIYFCVFILRRIAFFRNYFGIESVQIAWVPSLILAASTLIFGSICLLKDLTRTSDAYLLFFRPTWTAISVGAFALVALIISLLVLVVLALKKQQERPSPVEVGLESFTALISLVVILYTGVLLSSIAAVPFWSSPLLPVLFLLSSLSVGIAVVMIIGVFLNNDVDAFSQSNRILVKADVLLIALEIITLVLMIVFLGANPAAAASVELLVRGEYAPQFWVGFVACGLIIPLCIEIWYLVKPINAPVITCFTAALVLLGGFFLRYCFVYAGVHLSLFMFAGL